MASSTSSGLRRIVRALRGRRHGRAALRAARQLMQGFTTFDVNLVFDVGANVGQFGSQLRDTGFGGRLVSFEPLSAAHAALERAASGDRDWIVHPRCAIGAAPGTAEINVAANSVSSSLLAMSPTHTAAAANSSYVGREQVSIVRLDDVAPQYLRAGDRPFLKIDTQGFEWQILMGAESVLPRLQGVLCELSLVTLYEGQRLWREVIDYLEAHGFVLWALQPGFADPRTGRSLQADGIFFRR